MLEVGFLAIAWREYRNQGQERAKQEQDRLEQHEETAAQMEVWQKQIHADRVAEVFKTLRAFHNFLIRAIHINTFGPGRDYSEFGNISLKGGKMFQQYLDLQEAYYLSYLISDPLAASVKESMTEADDLQRINDPSVFHQSWKSSTGTGMFTKWPLESGNSRNSQSAKTEKATLLSQRGLYLCRR